MSPETRAHLTRQQAAAVAAAQRAKERADRDKLMRANQQRQQGEHARMQRENAEKKRLQDAQIAQKRAFNLQQSQKQQQRQASAAKQRLQAQDRLKLQRRNEQAAKNKTIADTRTRNAATARNNFIQQRNAAALAKTKAANLTNTNRQRRNQGLVGAQQYFNQQGVSGGQYLPQIQAEVNRIMSGLDPGQAVNPTMLENVGEDVYNKAQSAARNTAMGQVNPLFTTGFEQQLIPDTAAKGAIDKIQQEQFGEAQTYIDNLLKRGTITQPGYDKALQNLKGQTGTVNLQLGDIAKNVLAGGRQQLTDIGNQARTAASGLSLGQKFNPTTFNQQRINALKSFQDTIDPGIRTQVQGPLFDTSKLANIAGMATGAQNTAFDPYALNNTARPTAPQFDQSVMRSVF